MKNLVDLPEWALRQMPLPTYTGYHISCYHDAREMPWHFTTWPPNHEWGENLPEAMLVSNGPIFFKTRKEALTYAKINSFHYVGNWGVISDIEYPLYRQHCRDLQDKIKELGIK